MSETLEMPNTIATKPSVASDVEDPAVLIFCGIGLLVSLLVLLVAPEWVFQPQVIASVGLP